MTAAERAPVPRWEGPKRFCLQMALLLALPWTVSFAPGCGETAVGDGTDAPTGRPDVVGPTGADGSPFGHVTTLSGRVLDAVDGRGVASAIVATSPASASVVTNASGMFVMETSLAVGSTYRVSARKAGYAPGFVDVTVVSGSNQLADIVVARGPDDVACFPLCRLDYTCIAGVCVDGCNPPCPLAQVCRNGACVADCTPDCGARQCGPDPVCGVAVCGTCGPNEVCREVGRCECPLLTCGDACCAAGEVCADGGCCAPDCTDRVCGSDGCGGDCGHCDAPDECLDGRCEIPPCVPSCAGRECGDDGCAGTCAPGCPATAQCSGAGRCVDGFGVYVHIPAGRFTMGSREDDPGRGGDEAQHEAVLTRPFLLKATEVTQREWRTFMGNNPSRFPACGDDCPVERVNWWEAAAFCNALSEAVGLAACYEFEGCDPETAWGEGRACTGVSVTAASGRPQDCEGYRLPTEAEWEWAYRAGTQTSFYNGEYTATDPTLPSPTLDAIGWYHSNSPVTYAGAFDCSGWFDGATTCGVQPVGRKQPNDWGLYDMSGNVEEWAWDWWGGYPDPAPVDYAGPSSPTSERVKRGGTWGTPAFVCRGAGRRSGEPGAESGNVGVRPGRSIER